MPLNRSVNTCPLFWAPLVRAYLRDSEHPVGFTGKWTVHKVQRHASQKSYQCIYRLYDHSAGFPIADLMLRHTIAVTLV